MITDDELLTLKRLLHEKEIEEARKHLLPFASVTFQKFHKTPFHRVYYHILNLFAEGQIKRLIISVPPQHGKSLGSSQMLPAYILGKNPDTKIAIASYNATFARKFNRQIQRLVDEKEYREVFPKTHLNSSNVVTVASNYLRNADEFEVVGHIGGLKVVGRGGPLTGNPVDIMIMDDLYKDYAEGNSPVIRDAVWDWYTSVVRTRLHNDSQELIVFTRWHEDDLIGRLERLEKVVTINSLDDIDGLEETTWIKLNFEAIKTGKPTEIDPREVGEPLYPKRHNIAKLNADRASDPVKFDALYQGNPISAAGLLYGANWKTYSRLPENIIIRKNYTDTSDAGDDYTCSINYDVSELGLMYVIDLVYTDLAMEHTEPMVSDLITKGAVKWSDIESNSGGRGFARKINELTNGKIAINPFHQSANKESRVISNAATVMQKIIFPDDWHIRWPEFYNHVTRFKRNFKANKHDDAPDVLTGMVEKADHVPYQSPYMHPDEL
jgi:predicted phage terminase large subunit-like protein